MREIKYREITTNAEDGRSLSLSYLVLVDKSKQPERYEIKVVEGDSGEAAQALDLITDTKRTVPGGLATAHLSPTNQAGTFCTLKTT